MADITIPVAKSPATAAGNNYTDLKGLAAIKKDPNSPQAVHALAQQVDALFLQMMLKSMREAGAEEGEPDSNAMGMYQDLYDKQISLTLSQHGGIGIGALLTRQLEHQAAAKAAVAPASAAPHPTPATAPTAAPAATAVPPVGDTGSRPHTGAVTAKSASDFVKAVLPTIRAAAAALGVSPLGILAQAALETGWGNRMARTADGAPSLNLFGVKADPSWSGAHATANTVEFSGGVATQRQSVFRVYGSIADSVSDFAKLLSRSPRYARALAVGGDAQAYVKSIGQSGYATDPGYADKLHEILNGSTMRAALRGSTDI